MLTDEGLKRLSRRLLQRNSSVPFRRQNGPQVAAAVPDPAHRLSHPRSRLGNGRQGSDRQMNTEPCACWAAPAM